MMCENLKDGMLLTIKCPDRRGWLHLKSHNRLLKKYKNIPPKFVIGPDIISLLMRMEGVQNIVKPGDICVYLGKQKVESKSGKKKTLRLVMANGQVGFVEGRDFRHFEPV